MSRSIDERIVELEFQNGQFEKGVQTSIRSLNELKKSLDFDGAEKGLDDLKRSAEHFSMDGLSTAIEAVSGKFSAMEIVAISALNRITNQAMAAGERLVKSLSFDQISAGFSKYTDKTKSVNTIMNATGKDIDYVNERLDKLNWFTDETSYNFNDMVSNIGKFTSAGVDLDKATTAMMGIATEAALAGQGINEASRAMYNFAQAIGTGQVRLMDWRSIENANMATQEFKQTIIDTAKNIGTLSKTGKTVKGTEVTFKNFNETLSENWFTSEVLIESLRKYGAYAEEVYKVASEEGITAAQAMEKLGDAGMELGAKAFKAAQVARTFTDAIEATKDAVSSGWMQSFELIFGDVNESAELWTDVTNALWEVFAAGAESRNKVLQAWHDASEGGRADMLKGLYDSFESLWSIVLSVKQALADIFPVNWVDMLGTASKKVRGFGANLKKTFYVNEEVVGQEYKDVIEAVPKVSEAFDEELKQGSKGEGVKLMQDRLQQLGYDLGLAGVDGIFGPKTEAALKAYQEAVGQTIDGIYSEATHTSLLGSIFGTEDKVVGQELVDIVEEKFSPALEKIRSIAQGVFNIFKIGFNGVKLGWNAFTEVLHVVQPLTSALGKLGSVVGNLFLRWTNGLANSDMFQTWMQNIQTFLKPAFGWFQKAGEAVTDFFGLNIEYSSFEEFWSHIEESFQKYEIIGQIWNGLKSVFESIKNTILDFVLVTDEEGNKLGFFDSLAAHLSFLKPVADWAAGIFKSIFGISGSGDDAEGSADELEAKVSLFERIAGIFSKLEAAWAAVKAKVVESGVLDQISATWTQIKEKFSNIWPSVQNSLASINKSLFGEGYSSPIDWLLDRIPDWVDGILNSFSKLLELVKPYIDKIPSYIDKIKPYLETAKKTIQSAFEFVSNFVASLFGGGETGSQATSGKKKAAHIPGKNQNLVPSKKELKTTKSGFDSVFEFLGGLGESISKWMPAIAGIGTFLVTILSFKNVFGSLAKITENVRNIVKKPMSEDEIDLAKMKTFAGRMKALGETLLMIGASIALVAGSMWVISQIDSDRFSIAAETVGIIAAALVGITIALGALAKANVVDAKGIELIGRGLLELSGAIALIGVTMWLLGNADQAKMQAGFNYVASIALGLGFLVASLNGLNAAKLDLKGLLELSAAISILSLVVWLLGNADQKKLIQGGIVVGALITFLAGFVILISKFGKTSDFKIGGMMKLAIAIGILALVVKSLGKMKRNDLGWGVGAVAALGAVLAGLALAFSFASQNMDTKKSLVMMLELVALMAAFGFVIDQIRDVDPWVIGTFAGSLAAVMLSLAAAIAIVNKLGGGFGGSVKGAAGIGAALAIIVAIATAIVGGLGELDILAGGGLVEAVQRGGEVLTALANAFLPFDNALDNAILYGSILGASALAGATNVNLIGGAAEIGGALAVIVGIATAVAGLLGLVDESFDGDLVAAITDGGEVLSALVDALSPFDSWIENAGLYAGAIAASALGAWTGPSLIGGAAIVTSALGVIVGIATAIVAGIGAINEGTDGYLVDLVNSGGEVLGALGGALAQFGSGFVDVINGDLKDFGESIKAVRDGIKNIGIKEEVTSDLEIALGLVTSLRDYFATLEPYSVNGTDAIVDVLPEDGDSLDYVDERLGTYISAANQLNTDMGQFGEALGKVRTAITGLSDNQLTEDDRKLAIDIATQVHDFFADLQPYDVQPLADGGYFTAPGQLSTDLDSFGTAIGNFRDKIAGINAEYADLTVDTGMAIDVAGQVKGFFDDVSKDTAFLTTASTKEYRTAVENLFGDMDELSKTIAGFSTRLSSIKSKELETNTEAALAAVGTVSKFLIDAEKAAITVNSGPLGRFFGRGTKAQTIFQDMGTLGEVMRTSQTKLQGLGGEGSTWEVDFSAAMGSLTSMATFLNDISGLEIEPNKGWFDKFFTGDTNAGTVFQKVGEMGDQIKAAKRGVNELASGTFSEDFSAALRAFNAMATFLDRTSRLTVGDISIDIVAGQIEEVGQSVSSFMDSAGTIADSWFEEDFDIVMRAVRKMVALMAMIGSLEQSGTINQKTSVEPITQSIKDIGELFRSVEGTGIVGIQDLFSFADADFMAGFNNAMTMVDSMAAFLERLAGLKSEGKIASDTDFNQVLFPINSFSTMVRDLAINAAGIDLSAFSSTVTTIVTGYTSAAESFATFAQFASSDTITSTLASSVKAFTDAGAEMTEALADGLDEEEVTSAVITILSAAEEVADSRASNFETVGMNIATGLARGIEAGTSLVVSATTRMVASSIFAAKKESDQHSPSKVFAEIGKMNDLGLAKGITDFSKIVDTATGNVVQSAVHTAVDKVKQGTAILEDTVKTSGQETLSKTSSVVNTLSSLISENMDLSPTITPVVDWTNIDSVSDYLKTLDNPYMYNARELQGIMTGSSMGYRIAAEWAGPNATQGQIEAMMDQLHKEFENLTGSIRGMQIVMDSGTVVGEIGPAMDSYLGRQLAIERRR